MKKVDSKKKIIIIIVFAVFIAIIAAVIAINLTKKQCKDYDYDQCPAGCIVSSSGPMTTDIGCFPADHQKEWDKYQTQ